MKQMALDIGLAAGPTLDSFVAGPNEAVLQHLRLWVGQNTRAATRSPVPTYLWGPGGSGKTHLLKGVREALREQGAAVGWLDATQAEPGSFSEGWAAVLLEDVHRYSAVQQHAAFNWFVNAQTHQRWVLGAGDAAPAGLQVREDLRTRLGWGHVFALEPLAEQDTRAALRREADRRGIFLSDEVMDYLLTRFSRDLQHLMALLERLDEFALSQHRPVTVPLLRRMFEQEGATL